MTEKATAVISARCAPSFMALADEHAAKLEMKRGDMVILAVDTFINNDVQSLQRQLRAANIIISELQQKVKPEKIKTSKRSHKANDITRRNKSALAVYKTVKSCGGATHSEIAHRLKMSPNDVSTRRKELVGMGYLADSREQRKSKTSTKMQIVWKVTAKPIPFSVIR